MQRAKFRPYAIVSAGCVFPMAFDIDHYWRLLSTGETAFVPIPRELWDTSHFYSPDRRVAEKYFDNIVSYPRGFQFNRNLLKKDGREIADISRVESYFLTALNECVTKCPGEFHKPLVFVGHTSACDSGIAPLFVETAAQELGEVSGQSPEDIATSIRDAFGKSSFGWEVGPTTSASESFSHLRLDRLGKHLLGDQAHVSLVDAACASSLFSVEMGMMALAEGRCDIAFCGGLSFSNPFGKTLFCRLGGSSRHGVFPFEARADGTVFSDGAGFVAIKPLDVAEASGDSILAVIRGFGSSSDGKGTAIYAPNARGQILAMQRAYDSAGISPASVQFVEAHGTGTLAGDAVEFKSLQSYFQTHQPNKQMIALGSVKANVGHLGWAAGVASLIKVILSLKHRLIPAQPRFESLNPNLKINESPLYININLTPWSEPAPGSPRRAGINGFGFGGTNAHLIVEDYSPSQTATQPNGVVPAPPPSPRLAIVGVGKVFPNSQNPSVIRFEKDFRPDNLKYRVIDRSARVIDPTQFLMLEASLHALNQMGEKWRDLRTEIGVVVAQASPLSMQISLMKRIFFDYLSATCEVAPWTAHLEAWKVQIAQTTPKANEDAAPGVLPNVVAGRVANFFDLQGPNLTLNTGQSSFLSALKLAASYLHTGKCKIVLVGASQFSANNGELSILNKLTDYPKTEGAFALTLMTPERADELGFPILANLDLQAVSADDLPSTDPGSRVASVLPAPESGPLLDGLSRLSDSAPAFRIPTASPELSLRLSRGSYGAKGHTPLTVTLDPEADPFFKNHKVKGMATLSGSFMIELAARAACSAWPNAEHLAFEKIEFARFIRLPLNVRVVSESVAGDRLMVRILSDFINPKGIVLRRNLEHFRCEIEAITSAPTTPRISSALTGPFKALKDHFYQPGGLVYLDGPYMTIVHAETNGRVARAVFLPDSRYKMIKTVSCPFLLDGVFRLGALCALEPGKAAVPLSIENLTVAVNRTEADLALGPPVEVFFDIQKSTAWAVQDGHFILSFQDLMGASLEQSGAPIVKSA